MQSTAGRVQYIGYTEAITMAIRSGELLHGESDDAHAWALALIVSGLFEVIGEGETGADRFADGFARIARYGIVQTPVLGWEPVCMAKAVRNWIAHGMQLDRTQEMSVATGKRARVERIGLISDSRNHDNLDIYRVYLVGSGVYELAFSPSRFWEIVQKWYAAGGDQ